MRGMANRIVLVFFMAQFVAYFNTSNIGVLIAIESAELLELVPHDSLLGTVGSIVGWVALAGISNLLMGSASAKWAILAPIFVPIMMTDDMSPPATQMLYRIGDSSTQHHHPADDVLCFCDRHRSEVPKGLCDWLPGVAYVAVFSFFWLAGPFRFSPGVCSDCFWCPAQKSSLHPKR